jgi:hypothetical protein
MGNLCSRQLVKRHPDVNSCFALDDRQALIASGIGLSGKLRPNQHFRFSVSRANTVRAQLRVNLEVLHRLMTSTPLQPRFDRPQEFGPGPIGSNTLLDELVNCYTIRTSTSDARQSVRDRFTRAEAREYPQASDYSENGCIQISHLETLDFPLMEAVFPSPPIDWLSLPSSPADDTKNPGISIQCNFNFIYCRHAMTRIRSKIRVCLQHEPVYKVTHSF